MNIKNYLKVSCLSVIMAMGFTSCSDDDDANIVPTLDIPSAYVSTDFTSNAAIELGVVGELSTITSEINDAEANAPNAGASTILYPSTLSAVTEPNYRGFIQAWLPELVNAANANGFPNGLPDGTGDGGKLGSRLLDEYGLELEQMVQKGSFGSALYNHALTVVNAIKSGAETSSTAIDKLVAIHGAQPSFDVSEVTAAATYSRRRSNLTAETGFFFNIEQNLIIAKAAMDGGSSYDGIRDQALDEFLLNWEKSNYATVIYYCNAAVNQLEAAFLITNQDEQYAAFGNALHAYAEGVAFAHGFKRVSTKQITDSEIDQILANLLAPENQNPESYTLLSGDPSLLDAIEGTIDFIQAIYGFTDAEVESFFENNNP